MGRINRKLLAVTAAIAIVATAGCSAGGGGGESTTVRITLANHVWTENVKKAIPEFEKATGWGR